MWYYWSNLFKLWPRYRFNLNMLGLMTHLKINNLMMDCTVYYTRRGSRNFLQGGVRPCQKKFPTHIFFSPQLVKPPPTPKKIQIILTWCMSLEGGGEKYKTYARCSGPLSREGSLSHHTRSNMRLRFSWSHPKDQPIQSPLTTRKEMAGDETEPLCQSQGWIQL